MPTNEFGCDADFICTKETPWNSAMGMTFRHPDVEVVLEHEDGIRKIVECIHCRVSFRQDEKIDK